VTRKEPLWIEERDVFAIHDRLLVIHGGPPGLRDRGLLQSALARPRQHFTYASSTGIVGLAAIYAVGIIRNHPFVDGNKRTGFVVGVLFLELNGFVFQATEEDATQAIFDLAAGRMNEQAFSSWLQANSRSRKKR
jgi:death-on-curing protein